MVSSRFIRKQWLVILAVAIFGSALFYNVHEYSKYAKPVGNLVMGDNQTDVAAIVQYCQAQNHNEICDARVLGTDDKYIYAMLYHQGYDNIHTANASPTDAWASEARFTYASRPLRITGLTQVGMDNINPSVQSIYPWSIYKADKKIWFSWVSSPALDAKAREK